MQLLPFAQVGLNISKIPKFDKIKVDFSLKNSHNNKLHYYIGMVGNLRSLYLKYNANNTILLQLCRPQIHEAHLHPRVRAVLY